MRKILVAMADQHGGHKLGLLSPNTELYEEDESGALFRWRPQLTRVQEYLWGMYEKDIASVVALAAGAPIFVIHNGDCCHGVKYPQQLVSTRKADQILIAVANLRPWLEIENVEKMRIVQGTAAHGFGEGTADILVTEQLKALYQQKNIETLRHSLASVDGELIDYAHHGPSVGIRVWLTGNVARYYLRSLMMVEILAGRVPPRIVLRAHRHVYIRETVRINAAGTEFVSDIFILPAYCGLGDHARQVTQSLYSISNGLVAFEIANGELAEVYPFCRTIDLRTREEL